MRLVYLVAVVVGFYSCKNKVIHNSDQKNVDTLLTNLKVDTGKMLVNELANDSANILKEDPVFCYYQDSAFADVELRLQEISMNSFQEYKESYKTSCAIDSGGFIIGSGIVVSSDCKEICESYLVDVKSGEKLLLPTNYDAGIMGLKISPSCNEFIVYSSYDVADFGKYYENRAEVYCFSIIKDKGLKAIKPSFKYSTKDWSIDEMAWSNDNSIIMKVYEGDNCLGCNLTYRYFKAKIK